MRIVQIYQVVIYANVFPVLDQIKLRFNQILATILMSALSSHPVIKGNVVIEPKIAKNLECFNN